MCGISGVYNFASRQSVDSSVLRNMTEVILHRGPDGGEVWISKDGKVGLGHRRLSIIDLSTAATQPMPNEDETVWVTYNGEIYNHEALRQDLISKGHHFRTHHNDTEILVHGYEQWGINKLVNIIEGDYAFAIWDDKSKKIFLVRDRIGVKPLYFSIKNGILLFASEIKSILQHPSVCPEIDSIAMYHYLSFLTAPAPLTMFQGIYKLPAGYYLSIDSKGHVEYQQYWDAINSNQRNEKFTNEKEEEEYYVKNIQDLLKKSIKKRMMSDVPFGAFLSGGIDSSTNVALMSQLMNRPVDTFTVGFKDHEYLNELEYARQISKEFKTNHHEILIDEKDMQDYLPDLIYHQDEPLADWVCIPLYYVSKLAKDSGITVVQLGEGADEQFCGYRLYMDNLNLHKKFWSPYKKSPQFVQNFGAWLAKNIAKRRPSLEVYADMIDRATRDRELFWSGATFFWDIMKDQALNKDIISPIALDTIIDTANIIPRSYLETDSFNIIKSFKDRLIEKNPQADVLTQMIYNEFKLRLPELLLTRVDKITMSNSLEARVPFLDHHLVEFSLQVPTHLKIKDGETKYILKKAVEGILPDNIIYRKKMGFGAPMPQWLKGTFGQEVQSSILSSNLVKRKFINKSYVIKLFDNHRINKDSSRYIWTLYNLTAWYDYWIDKKNV